MNRRRVSAVGLAALALVVVGGMMLAPILILVILPVLILMFSRRTSH
jgi:Cu/Ag efflux pump CusA